jgi:hypothetical protein
MFTGTASADIRQRVHKFVISIALLNPPPSVSSLSCSSIYHLWHGLEISVADQRHFGVDPDPCL